MRRRVELIQPAPPSMVLIRVSTEALPKEERIAKRRDFLRAYEQGRKEISRYAVIFALDNGLGHPRIGITATRKLGGAAVRNRVKRWIREIYRRQRTPLGFDDTSFDIVVNVKTNAAKADYGEFSGDLSRVLRRIISRATNGLENSSGATPGRR